MPTQPSPSLMSDFSANPLFVGSSPFGSAYTLVGNRFEAAPSTVPQIYMLDKDSLPGNFPLQQWYDQAARYGTYWAWFNGDFINQGRQNKRGEIEFRFPLRINSLRDIVRKNTAVLYGEVPDGPEPLVATSIKARKNLAGKPAEEEQHDFATMCENIVNEVWMQSNGRAIQQEGGELSQFLGGHVFQICYQSWREDVAIPFFIKSWKADYFLPVWKHGNYWELSKAYIVTRIEAAIAESDYGVKIEGAGVFAYYVEEWNEDTYSIYINNKPIRMIVDDVEVEFKDVKNPFGFVPFMYIPHMREGSFFGTSHVPDVAGLIEEYNSAMADLGDAIRESIERERYMRDSNQRTRVELPGTDREAINLGPTNPSTKTPPDVFVEDPPTLSAGLVAYPAMVYDQLRRSGYMPPVSEGEDEGSQRSGVTLDIRFWSATSHAKVERSYWETGLSLMARMLLKMVHIKDFWKRAGWTKQVPEYFMQSLMFSQNWSPQLPRDRQSEVNELLSRLGGDGASLRHFLHNIGDVENVEEEENLIREWMTFKAGLKAKPNTPDNKPLGSSQFEKQNASIDEK